MSVCLGKQRQHATGQITATHGMVLQVIQRVEGLGHKIFMDTYFTSPALFDDLFQQKISVCVCGTLRHDRQGMPQDNWTKISKNGKGGHRNPKGCSLERQAECVYSDKHAHTPLVVENYSAYMGLVDKSDRMVNSCGIAQITWKWTKKLFFHLTDMTILNAFLIHKSCGGKIMHKNFREILVCELIIHLQEEM